ncbi:hypothetical protein SpiGrapes_0243 [Sphaerochaeta pleomorpha str. Grapes]|uniref:HTH arsR-type domain-containing protein n=1 Tax=Sphaerochaeta pleomorpha (strain ATCC BAA-1885 / DSM 22778 / Grapes) TaxID=158190 RepID=G8QUD6_SPHPG|nr:helix-turn-helix domain-containing protein [Sphaerochaeta pleomorpha]AEV28106.1 hypothetical protein SpiGrapes_0243 [Sphaerochaeta pleomorpha str. Grapes]
MKNINEVMLHPVRMRIVQEIAMQKTITTTQLSQVISDVPRTTLYRHINLLIDYNIVTIVSERKIRGSIERTLSLNLAKIQKLNTLENASQNALAFLLEKYGRFHTYFSGGQPNPGKDRIFLNNTVLMLNDNEFDQFLSEMQKLLVNYSFKAGPGRKARDISLISSPVEETEK